MKKVIVVGGGASGLVAAICGAREGAIVTILERNNSCGKKILVTGNGRCNYYNSDQDICHYHSSNCEYISNVINDYNNDMLLDFFDSIGLVPNIRDGYYYPMSNQAVSVLNCLVNECNMLRVNIVVNECVNDIKKDNGKFYVMGNNNTYCCDSVIVSTGSYSYYKNVNINGYDIASSLGHKIIEPKPALVQLMSSDKFLKDISGVRDNASIKLVVDDKEIASSCGEILFTSYGISGICCMQVSRYVSINLGSRIKLVVNLIPSICSDKIECIKYLDSYCNRVGKRTLIQIMDSFINYKLGNCICNISNINGNCYWDELSYVEKDKIASYLVNFSVNVDGTKSFNDSQVCLGGVSLESINTNTMESNVVNGLYFTGEVCDVDGDCGGYNLTFAWLSGIIAGVNSSKETIND